MDLSHHTTHKEALPEVPPTMFDLNKLEIPKQTKFTKVNYPELRGDVRPDKFGQMKIDRKLPLKEQALLKHPSLDLGSYYYGGPQMTTKFRPSF
jgi:hypothetical protein